MALVYKITNTVNNKFYVGVTRVGLQRRVVTHFWAARTNRPGSPVLYHAIRKYGEEAFAASVLSTHTNFEDALRAERDAIATLLPHYNVSAGGVGPNGMKWSRKRKKIMREKLRAAWTDERRALMSEKLSKRVLTEEMKARLRECFDLDAVQVSVVCLDDGKWFESVKSAAKFYGVLPNRISTCCRGYEVSVHGLRFCYAKKPLSEKTRRSKLAALKKRLANKCEASRIVRSRPVICLTDGVRYPSISSAAKAYGVSPLRIVQICQGKGQTRNGTRFMYADAAHPPVQRIRTDADLESARQRRQEGLKRARQVRGKPVICIDDGKAYANARSASKAYGMSASTVWNAIELGFSVAHGRIFKFVDPADYL